MITIVLFLITIFLPTQVFSSPQIVFESDHFDHRRGCWATFYEEINYEGSQLTVFNSYDIPELNYSTGPYWGEHLNSLIVGITGKITLFSETEYKGKKYTIGPANKMSPLPWEVQSFKLECVIEKKEI